MYNDLINECLTRMVTLKLDKKCINTFRYDNKVLKSSYYGALYELNTKEQEIITEFENKHKNCKVYHVIHNLFDFGECYTLLYADLDEQDHWKEELEDLADGYAFSYVKNVTEEYFSEFGSVFIQPMLGGVIRLS